MSVLSRKLSRQLWSSAGLLLTIASVIAVGIACYVAMAGAYNNLQQAKARYYRQCNVADFSIELKKVPTVELTEVANLEGVASLRPRIQFYATVDMPEVPTPQNGLVLSLPDRREPTLNDIVLRAGGYFTPRRRNEVIVNDAFALRHRLEPGDSIDLLLNNRKESLFIVGTAISAEFVYLLAPGSIVPDPEHFGVFYIKQSYAEEVFDFAGAANQVVGRLSPDHSDGAADILDRAETILSPYGVFATIPLADQPSNKYLTQEIEGLKTFGYFMPAIFLVAAALILNVLLTRLAEQQRTTIGTLKAIGYSNRQVFWHFLQFALAVGLLGGIAGCALGHWLASVMTTEYRKYFEFPELVNQFYPSVHAIGLTVSLVCAVLGSMKGTRAVLRLSPAEAMRPKPPKQGGAVMVERIGWLWNRLSSGWRMVVRDVMRNRVRTAAGIFSTALGAAVLVSGFMMTEATYYLVDFQFRWLSQSDLDLSFKDTRGEDALAEVSRLPGVDRAEPTLVVAGTFSRGSSSKKGGIMGLSHDARLTVPRDVDARPIRIPDTGLMMSRKMAEILDVRRGDWITFRPVRGLRRNHRVQVVEIANSYLGTLVYADIRYLSRLVDEELAVTGAQLAIDRDPEHLARLYAELKRLPGLQAVNARADMVRGLEETIIQQMGVFIGMLVLLAGMVFFGTILNASLVSLAERQREIATLRCLGYGPWRIGGLLFRESLLITAGGTLLGMPLGYLLAMGASRAYDTEMFRFPVVSSAATWIWTILLSAVFAFAAHLCVQRAIHRMEWLDALNAKE